MWIWCSSGFYFSKHYPRFFFFCVRHHVNGEYALIFYSLVIITFATKTKKRKRGNCEMDFPFHALNENGSKFYCTIFLYIIWTLHVWNDACAGEKCIKNRRKRLIAVSSWPNNRPFALVHKTLTCNLSPHCVRTFDKLRCEFRDSLNNVIQMKGNFWLFSPHSSLSVDRRRVRCSKLLNPQRMHHGDDSVESTNTHQLI